LVLQGGCNSLLDPPAAALVSPMSKPLHVLIIEDSERDAALLLRELRRGGYDPIHERVDTADDLKAAIDRGPWEIAIADHFMPHLTVSDALAVIGNSGIDIPIIIVSGTIGEEAAVSAMRAGARDFISKGALARLLPAIERELREAAMRAERREISERLEDANRRFMNAIESISEAFAIYDANDRLIHMNSHFRTLFGPDWRSGLLGRTFEDLLQEEIAHGLFPEAAGREKVFLRRRLAAHHKADESFLYKIRDGRWLRARDYKMRDGSIFAVRTDVTDLVRQDEALKQSQASLAAAQQIAKLGSWEMDLVDPERLEQNPVRWSDETFRIYGYEPGEIEVSNGGFYEAVHPDDRETYVRLATRAAAEGAPYGVEFRAKRKDGREIVVHEMANTLTDASGRPVKMLGTAQDVTEHRSTEERLRQSQKMEAVGQLTGGIAHDFNNLLTVIINAAETLDEQIHGKATPSSWPLDSIFNAVEQATALTRRLLAFARKQPLEPRNVNINEFITRMKPLLQRTLGENVDVRIDLQSALWTAYVDAHQVESVVLNLAINARDAMPDGGHLMIETANVTLDDDEAAHYADVIPGDYVALSVSDNGSGMPAEVLAHAIEPFFTTKPTGKGTGLGLSMAYGFAKQSGGHMNIYSEVGSGTTVRLYFPRTNDRGEPEVRIPGTQSDLPHGREVVLVVEDDAAVRQTATGLLRSLGYTVLEAAGGNEALSIANGGQAIDLLLTDVMMPGGLAGPTLAEEMRKLRPTLRVLYTSGYAETALVHQGELNNKVELLQKPYRRQALAQKVRAILDRS
jgi:PAS domain S-box-containing protein